MSVSGRNETITKIDDQMMRNEMTDRECIRRESGINRFGISREGEDFNNGM